MTSKPIIALDFDGCLHSYEHGWQEGRIYGTLVPGFIEWALETQKSFRLIIHSSRTGTDYGVKIVRDWLQAQRLNWPGRWPDLEVWSVKPPAFISIDDRAIQFNGDWTAAELQPEVLRTFKPWMTK